MRCGSARRMKHINGSIGPGTRTFPCITWRTFSRCHGDLLVSRWVSLSLVLFVPLGVASAQEDAEADHHEGLHFSHPLIAESVSRGPAGDTHSSSSSPTPGTVNLIEGEHISAQASRPPPCVSRHTSSPPIRRRPGCAADGDASRAADGGRPGRDSAPRRGPWRSVADGRPT